MKQKKYPLRLDEDSFEEIKEEMKETGLSMNKLLNLKIKGFEVKKRSKKK